jgi:Trk K+ transport system NAD-binding subunit
LLIPHGDTQLLAGDVVTLLCEKEHIEEVELILHKGGGQPSSKDSARKS